MVERLCRDYGTPILHSTTPKPSAAAASQEAEGTADAPVEEQMAVPDLAFYSFPTLEQLSAASESALRAEGFGYRYCQHASHCHDHVLWLILLCIAL